MAVLIPRNSTIPTEQKKPFSTNRDNQTEVTIKVYEGERHQVRDNSFLGEFKVFISVCPLSFSVPLSHMSLCLSSFY